VDVRTNDLLIHVYVLLLSTHGTFHGKSSVVQELPPQAACVARRKLLMIFGTCRDVWAHDAE
jgi:hypothetical protein